MVDARMTARCQGNAALLLASPGSVGILPATVEQKRDTPAQGGASSPSEPHRPSGSADGPSAYFKAENKAIPKKRGAGYFNAKIAKGAKNAKIW